MTIELFNLDWITTASVIVPILIPILIKILQSRFFIKIRTEAHKYYLLVNEKKNLIVVYLLAISAILLFAFLSYNYFYPHSIVEKNLYRPSNFIGNSNGAVNAYIFGQDAVKIDKNQIFEWPKGWNENTKLRRIKLNYYSTGTSIQIFFGLNNTIYALNGISPLVIEDISIPYQNFTYGLNIINIGESPFYLYSMETEEEITQAQNNMFIVIGIYCLIPIPFFYKKHKNRKAIIKPFDLLYKDAKIADRVKILEVEIENCQNMLEPDLDTIYTNI